MYTIYPSNVLESFTSSNGDIVMTVRSAHEMDRANPFYVGLKFHYLMKTYECVGVDSHAIAASIPIHEGDVIVMRLRPIVIDNPEPKSHAHHRSASIKKNTYCKACHFPVVFVCCNGDMQDYAMRTTGAMWDWWLYCANKGCVNHVGEGLFQGKPNWTYRYDN
jgi:hypothetical protein